MFAAGQNGCRSTGDDCDPMKPLVTSARTIISRSILSVLVGMISASLQERSHLTSIRYSADSEHIEKEEMTFGPTFADAECGVFVHVLLPAGLR